MITYRLFKSADANDVAKVVAKTLKISNRKDYSHEYIEADIKSMSAQFFIDKAKPIFMYFVMQIKLLILVLLGHIGEVPRNTVYLIFLFCLIFNIKVLVV